MPDYENAIEIKDLTKKYDGFTLDSISFAVPKGCIMGFIGQNGAGKTTTIRALLNIIKTDGGTINMLGLNHIKDEYTIKEQIAAVFDEIPFHESFNAHQVNIMFRGLYSNWNEEQFFSYLDRFSLPRKKKIAKFSKGMKMKLQIATALSHGAKLLIMDEATTGLDPVVRNEILDIFREYIQDEDHSVLMSSHITSDLEKIADCVTFIDRGKILLTGFKDEILEIKYRGKNIHDILEMSVDDAIDFFAEDRENSTCRRIVERLQPLQDVGLGYIRLGQSSSTLSGGESQRVKLASFLSKDNDTKRMMFIFDEPTTGLHFHDINRLLKAFNALITNGHTIVIVEHNMEVIKCADWVIDLGPEAGDRGGKIVFEGTPKDLEQCDESHTGHFLKEHNKA